MELFNMTFKAMKARGIKKQDIKTEVSEPIKLSATSEPEEKTIKKIKRKKNSDVE